MDVHWRRAAAYVVCRDEANRLLLTRFVSSGHPDSGKWTMPGGAMEWGESPVATAARELEEETGLSAAIGPVIGVSSRWFTAQESVRGEAGHAIGIVYEAHDIAGQIRVDFEEGTTGAATWFALDEIRTLPRVSNFVLGLI